MIIDCSVAMAWCFEDEWTPAVGELLDRVIADGGVVPSVWTYEVANVLAVAERLVRLTEAQVGRAMDLLAALPLELLEDEPDLMTLGGAARHHELSAYDAAYLVAAIKEGRPLATLDSALRDAATCAGVHILP